MGATAVLLEAMGLFDDEQDTPTDPLDERKWQRVRLRVREWLRAARVARYESSKGKYRSRQRVMEKMLVVQLDEYERANPQVLSISLEQMLKDAAEDEALENAITEAEERARVRKRPTAPSTGKPKRK